MFARSDEQYGPAEVVAEALDKVRPVALRVRAIRVARHAHAQAHRPHARNPQRTRSITSATTASAMTRECCSQALKSDAHDRERAGGERAQLDIGVQLARPLAKGPVGVEADEELHGEAGHGYEQVAHAHVEHEAVARLAHERTVGADHHGDERVADQGGQHEQQVEWEAHEVDQVDGERRCLGDGGSSSSRRHRRLLVRHERLEGGERERLAHALHRLAHRLEVGQRLQACRIHFRSFLIRFRFFFLVCVDVYCLLLEIAAQHIICICVCVCVFSNISHCLKPSYVISVFVFFNFVVLFLQYRDTQQKHTHTQRRLSLWMIIVREGFTFGYLISFVFLFISYQFISNAI